MPLSLETMYQERLRFSYCSFDRIVIRGHVPVLQGKEGGGVVAWARSLEPDAILTSSWFEEWATKFHVNVKKFATEHHIPIIAARRNQEKNEISREYLPKEPDFTGVYLIIQAREMTYSFTGQKSKHNSNPRHRNIIRQDRCVDHFYFYLVDKYWGPICVRFSSHLPFNVKVYLNGNRWLGREAAAHLMDVKTDDNVIIECNDARRLQTMADSLDQQKIRSVCDHWAYRLLPVLTYQQRHHSQFKYEWFLDQVEYSHNMVFKSPWSLTQLFHQHIGINYEHFHPHQIERFFGHCHGRDYRAGVGLRLHHQTEAVTVLRIRSRGCSLKQYNKGQRVFRSEITITNVKELHVQKSITNISRLSERMKNVLCSFQSAQASVHQAQCTGGELAALAQPGVVGQSHVAGIKLDNERIMSLLALLPRLVRYAEGFRISELKGILDQVSPERHSTSQISYDLRKLRAKKLIERVSGQRRYRVTTQGAAVAAVLPTLAHHLGNSVIGLCLYPTKSPMPEKFRTPLDQCYYRIEKEISLLMETTGLRAG